MAKLVPLSNHMLLALLCLLAVGAAPKWRLYGHFLQYSQEPGVSDRHDASLRHTMTTLDPTLSVDGLHRESVVVRGH